MEETPEFRNGQKQINKTWKNSWLSTNARLNIILKAINDLSRKHQVSFGQAQKPINVLLKYHY